MPKAWGKNVKPYPAKNVWHNLLGTYDGRRVRFYINGVLDTEEVAETPGLIDEVKIWKRALTASEVKLLYEQTLDKNGLP